MSIYDTSPEEYVKCFFFYNVILKSHPFINFVVCVCVCVCVFSHTDHQYHNDFLSPAYGKDYNSLVEAALEDGRIKITGCPDRV